MKVILINNQDKINLDINFLERVASYISDKFDKDLNCELNIVFVDREEIKNLNKKYRGVNKETDVLSFSYNGDKDILGFEESIDAFRDEHGFYTLGEIIICPEVAEENIKKDVGITKDVEECIRKEVVNLKKGAETSTGADQDIDWNLNLELILLIIHGILHVYGYDHEEKEDRAKMENIQKSILQDVRATFGL
ncbi:MAG: rRNA maturation RNase YbeY [Actinobacteria bacterium]|nr:rRNA maturation RNase YbeY [Actinomycetota bacterium]